MTNRQERKCRPLGDIDMPEEFLFRSGLSNLFTASETWIAVAYVAGMFLVLTFRPQQISAPSSFRMSYVLFALYFIVPSSINGVIWLTLVDHVSRSGGEMHLVLFQLTAVVGKVLLGLSIVFAFGSLRPRLSGFSSVMRTDSEAAAFWEEKRARESD
jgi:hypothetical protein